MAFAANPLSLSVTDAAFESWLRDNGYLEVLDDRATASGAAVPSLSSSSSLLPDLLRPAVADGSLSAFPYSFSSLRSLASLFTLNPFAKLTAEDLTRSTPSWTLEFIGSGDFYSWPARPSQARMRVQENVRRYARNYAVLSLLVFACSLYKMPVALLGLLVCLFMWELVRFSSYRWHLEERRPGLRQVLIYTAQLATAMILYVCNLQLAIACAVGVSYGAMIFHAFLHKLTPRSVGGGNRHKVT